MGHSLLSPSAAHRWAECPGSLAACRNYPSGSSKYADEGTLAHSVVEAILNVKPYPAEAGREMIDYASRYTDAVLSISEGAVQTWVEQELDLSEVYGESDQSGTGDFIALVPLNDKGYSNVYELQVHDLKYGMGVKVSAQGNKQLMIYGLGALDLASMAYDGIIQIRLFIHMPRLGFVDEVLLTVEEMEQFRDEIREAAKSALLIYSESLKYADLTVDESCFKPGEKQCRFCPHKANCKALEKFALGAIVAEFDDLEAVDLKEEVKGAMEAVKFSSEERLARLLPALDLISSWIKAVESQAYNLLLNGGSIPGYKIVEGKLGNRKWSSEEEAEEVMKSMRLKLDEMYVKSVISPTVAEKLLKDCTKKWNRLKPLITRSGAKPTLVEESDKRPAIVTKPVEECFDDLTANDDLV
jgi:hypothetical protein